MQFYRDLSFDQSPRNTTCCMVSAKAGGKPIQARSTLAILASEITNYVSSETLNPAHSLTHADR